MLKRAWLLGLIALIVAMSGERASLAAFSQNSETVDPADLLLSTFLGGESTDRAQAMAVGPDGSIYLAGYTYSSSLSPMLAPLSPAPGNGDIVVARLNAGGSALLYTTVLGGSGRDLAYDLALDTAGNLILTGETQSSDFPTTPGAYDTSFNGGLSDIFVVKLDASGNLLYSTYLGGSGLDCEGGCALAVGPDQTAYVTSVTFSTDFPTTPGAYDSSFNGPVFGTDVIITRLSTDGGALLYSTYLGGSNDESGRTIAVDANGQATVSGHTFSSTFPTTAGAYDRSCGGCPSFHDAFLARLNATGSALVYSTFLGGSEGDVAMAVAVDRVGAAYLTGYTLSADFPTTPGAFDASFNGGGFECFCDAYVSKINPTGSNLLYSTFLGGGGDDFGHAIAVAANGEAYVAGETESPDFPTTASAFDRSWGEYLDAFVTKLTSDGSNLAYSTFLGGSGPLCKHEICRVDSANDVVAGDDGAIYVTGRTSTTNFPTTPGALDRTCGTDGTCNTQFGFPSDDAFVSKLSPDLPVMHVAAIHATYRRRAESYLVGCAIRIRDNAGAPVGKATISILLTAPSGQEIIVSRTTNEEGAAFFGRLTTMTGTYVCTVQSVEKEGWIYNPAQNAEISDGIVVP